MKPLATIVALLCTLLFTQPQPSVHFSATWSRASVARLTWTQPTDATRACITRIPTIGPPVHIGCREDIPAGSQVVITLGDNPPTDALYKPDAGDNYVLSVNGQTYTAALQAVLRLPVIRG